MQEVGTPAAEDRLDDDVVVLTHFKPPPGCKPFARLADEGERWDRNEQKILDLKVDFFIETINRFEYGAESAKRTVVYNWMEETLRGGSAYQFIVSVQTKGYVAWVYYSIKKWAGNHTPATLAGAFNDYHHKLRKFQCLGTLLANLEEEADKLNLEAENLKDDMRITASHIRQ